MDRPQHNPSTNTNPIQLDSDGCAIIYGIGTYRQQLYDGPVVGGMTTGNLIFDLPTTDTSAYNSVFWASLAGGTPNVITIVDTGFNATDGTVINFLALSTNTGATTINPSGYGAITVEKLTTGGPVSLTGGEIVQNNVISVIYSATLNAFLLTNPPIQSASGNANPLCGMSGLKIINNSGTPNTEISLSASDLVTTNTGGTIYNRTNPSVTINASVTGANGLDTGNLADSTWYYVWWIDNGSAAAGLLSLSSTSPLLPSGYTTECRAGGMITDASGNFLRTLQLGTHAQYRVSSGVTNNTTLPVIATGAAGSTTTPTWVSESITGIVPTTASEIKVALVQNSSSRCMAAPNNSYGAYNSITNPPPLSNSDALVFSSATFLIENQPSASVYYASDNSGNACALFALGWTDQVNAN